MVYDGGDEVWENSLGRFAFAMLLVLFATVIACLLHPKRGVLFEYMNRHQGGWVDRLRYVWFAAVSGRSILLAAASLLGYHYTALRLAMLVYRTAMTLVGIFILYGLAKRWLLLSRRRLAIAQAKIRLEEAQRESAIAAAGSSIPHDVRSTEFRNEIRNEQKALDLAAINAQTMSLVSACAVVAALVSVIWIWSDVLPAVNALDSIKLWQIENTAITSVYRTVLQALPAALVPLRSSSNNIGSRFPTCYSQSPSVC